MLRPLCYLILQEEQTTLHKLVFEWKKGVCLMLHICQAQPRPKLQLGEGVH